MPFALLLALRYLRASRRGGAARATAAASVAAVACGVAAYIVAAALAAGFRDEMRAKILRGTPHITVTSEDASRAGAPTIDEASVLREIKRVPGVRRASRTTFAGALLIGAGSNAYTIVRGVDPHDAKQVDEVRRTIVAGSVDDLSIEAAPNVSTGGASGDGSEVVPIVVGSELAARTGLLPGARAQIISAAPASIAHELSPRVIDARVVGVFRVDLHDYDATWIYAPLESALAMERGAAGDATTAVIAIETEDAFGVDEIAARIRERSGAGWTAVTWQEANKALFAALELERLVVRSIISLVTIVAALNIFTTLALTVNERRAQIATLAALGARASTITAVFIIEGASLGLFGALAGACFGVAACRVATAYELVRLPAEVYAIGFVPLRARASDIAAACLVALFVSLVAAAFAARRAARVRAAAALRPES